MSRGRLSVADYPEREKQAQRLCGGKEAALNFCFVDLTHCFYPETQLSHICEVGVLITGGHPQGYEATMGCTMTAFWTLLSHLSAMLW